MFSAPYRSGRFSPGSPDLRDSEPLDELHPHRQIRHAGGDGRPAHLGLSGPGAGCAATRSPAQRGRDASPLAEDFLL